MPPLSDLIAGAASLGAWPWVPALGLGLALRADGVSACVAIAVLAGALAAIRSLRRESRGLQGHHPYGRTLLLAVMMLGAAVADDLALLWCCLEVAALAQAGLLHGDAIRDRRPASALAAFAVAEAGGLALLAAALLAANVSPVRAQGALTSRELRSSMLDSDSIAVARVIVDVTEVTSPTGERPISPAKPHRLARST